MAKSDKLLRKIDFIGFFKGGGDECIFGLGENWRKMAKIGKNWRKFWYDGESNKIDGINAFYGLLHSGDCNFGDYLRYS